MKDYWFKATVIGLLLFITVMLMQLCGWTMEVHSRVVVYLPEIFKWVIR